MNGISKAVLEVRKIDRSTAEKVIVAKHYTRRLGIMWEAFGLYAFDCLIGVVCYGQPSAPINKHSFANRDFRLYELTRLVVDRGYKNGASFLISQSLKMLSQQPCAVISYADSANGHCGIVYQATNWIYTGATVSHDCLYKVGDEILHPMTVIGRFKCTNPGQWAKENNIERIKPGEKFRYFKFVGNKKQTHEMRKNLKYPIVETYPKVDKKLYDDGAICGLVI
jgi:hypothetical protein